MNEEEWQKVQRMYDLYREVEEIKLAKISDGTRACIICGATEVRGWDGWWRHGYNGPRDCRENVQVQEYVVSRGSTKITDSEGASRLSWRSKLWMAARSWLHNLWRD